MARLPRGRLRKTLFFAGLLIGVSMLALYVSSKAYRLPSSAMEPTFHCARPGSGCEADHMDRVLVSRFTYRIRDPHRGDVAAFHLPDTAPPVCGVTGDDVVYLKRVVALPGEHWRERNGFIYINGTKLNEPYVKSDRRDAETIPLKTVPEDEYLMLGDNRSSSCDSRRFGTVPRDNLIGPLYAVYWPPGRIGFK
ncbi:MAG TPA: signal peptidase I [Gaiellaceae bacterium]